MHVAYKLRDHEEPNLINTCWVLYAFLYANKNVDNLVSIYTNICFFIIRSKTFENIFKTLIGLRFPIMVLSFPPFSSGITAARLALSGKTLE